MLCRKVGPETSTGIRPLILDLHGMLRDDEIPNEGGIVEWFSKLGFRRNDEFVVVSRRLDSFVQTLEILGKLCTIKNAFYSEKRSDNIDLPVAIVKGCSEFDVELFRCRFLDYHDLVMQQKKLVQSSSFEALGEEIRLAEMEMSIAAASSQSLQVIRQRLEVIDTDRTKRFEVLKQMVEDVCFREMNLFVVLQAPEKTRTLVLQETSAIGLFGIPLQMAGETLPIG